MRDHDLYQQILGLSAPWKVTRVDLDREGEQVEVFVEADRAAPLNCPKCNAQCSRYDSRPRRWRHLDTCQYRTILVAEVPRVECLEHGVVQVAVPWGDPRSRFTALFEAVAINWLMEACISAVARQLRLSWDEVDGIQQRAVRRGIARREHQGIEAISIDEVAIKKRHRYATIMSNPATGHVVAIAKGRTAGDLEALYMEFTEEQLAAVKVVSMDMWGPYISATRGSVPDADQKIAFDKFHVAKHLGDALDKVRRHEHRELLAAGDVSLKGTKHLWLQNPENMKPRAEEALANLTKSSVLRTARAWALKEYAMTLWSYARRGWARKAWEGWLSWAVRSRLEPIKKVARMIRNHLEGILNAIYHRATNASAESINAKIQRVKRMACGFRSYDRLRTAIFFHLGGLDLYPATHTKP